MKIKRDLSERCCRMGGTTREAVVRGNEGEPRAITNFYDLNRHRRKMRPLKEKKKE